MGWRWIDMENDPRRAHFEYFRSLPNNQVGVTVNVDVTDLHAFCKRSGASFYLAFMHVAALAADGVPELRRRIREGRVVEYDACGTSHVELAADGSYGYCTLEHHMPWAEYLERAEAARRRCRDRASIEEDADVDALYFVTCLPWLRFRDFTQPTDPAVSNPHISWGKLEEDWRGRRVLPVNLLAHHALVDGVHIAAFFRNLDEQLAAFGK